MRGYAQQIAEAETKAWKSTALWNSGIAEATPQYANKFRVSNIYEDFKSLVLVKQLQLPDSLQKLANQGILDALLEMVNSAVTKEQYNEILAEIEEFVESEPIDIGLADSTDKVGDGVGKQATDDGEGARKSGAE